ncbi:hypothetical protein evm_006037 [Chilo suppressalis]|nr:hypothetical protein evm_006037 [Chilo suppressalis]
MDSNYVYRSGPNENRTRPGALENRDQLAVKSEFLKKCAKHKRTRKKRNGLDDSNSLATDDSASFGQLAGVASAKASLQNVPTTQTLAAADNAGAKRERDSSPSVSRSPGGDDCRSPGREDRRSCRSPRRYRRINGFYKSYGDNAIGYVQIKRDGKLCTVKGRVLRSIKYVKKVIVLQLF